MGDIRAPRHGLISADKRFTRKDRRSADPARGAHAVPTDPGVVMVPHGQTDGLTGPTGLTNPTGPAGPINPIGRTGPGGRPTRPGRAHAPAGFGRPDHRRHRRILRPLRVRGKLIALVLIPMIGLLSITGLLVSERLAAAEQAGTVQLLAELGKQSAAVIHELQLERDLTAGLPPSSRQTVGPAITAQRASVDRAIAEFRTSSAERGGYTDEVRRRLSIVDLRLTNLQVLRITVPTTALPTLTTMAKYSTIIADLLGLIDQIGQATADRTLAEPVRVLDALARAKEFASQERALANAILASPSETAALVPGFVTAANQERGALAEFREIAGPEERQNYEDTVTGALVDRTEQVKAAILFSNTLAGLDLGSASWLEASNGKQNLVKSVEDDLISDIVRESDAAQGARERDSALVATAALAVFLVALAMTVLISRSLARPLRRLRASAMAVALTGLSDAVAAVQAGEEVGALAPRPREGPPRDEIDEVSQAFDAVHAEAIKQAASQSALRRNVVTLFGNLAQRSQSLVERQINLIDQLEAGEKDPDRLESLFRLDHLATRMRRTGENLLVLSGGRTTRRVPQAVEVETVLQAALGEIEDYRRIGLTGHDSVTGVHLVGYCVPDVAHLLAELLENGAAFSPPSSSVTVSGRLAAENNGVIVEVTDGGVGMKDDQLAAANQLLNSPPSLDLAGMRAMGLFVVARLAQRHGILVRLQPSPGSGGLTAVVHIPQRLVAPPPSKQRAAVGPSKAGRTRTAAPSSLPAAPPVARPLTGSTALPAMAQGPAAAPAAVPAAAPAAPAAAPAVGRTPARERERGSAPTNDGRADDTPIFDQISVWLRRDARHRRSGPRTDRAATAAGSPAGSVGDAADRTSGVSPSTWNGMAADSGWAAATAASGPTIEGRTATGLPRRRPQANTIPGSAQPARPISRRPARLVGSQLSTFSQSAAAGRSSVQGSDLELPTGTYRIANSADPTGRHQDEHQSVRPGEAGRRQDRPREQYPAQQPGHGFGHVPPDRTTGASVNHEQETP